MNKISIYLLFIYIDSKKGEKYKDIKETTEGSKKEKEDTDIALF